MTNGAVDLLLVEDNAADLELVLRELDAIGFKGHIKVARDGADAVDYLFAEGAYAERDPLHTPKVIVLDLKLPRMDGFDVLRRMRRRPHTRNIPVAILSSSFQDRDIVEGYALGANTYFVKPINSEQFSEVIQRIGRLLEAGE